MDYVTRIEDVTDGMLADPCVRDMAILMAVGVTDPHVLEAARQGDGRVVGRELSARLVDGSPDPMALAHAARVLERLPGAGAAATLAYVYWLSGREADAMRAVYRAAGLDPSMTLPMLVGDLIEHGERPPFVKEDD